jgi:hypothetical protein
LTNFEEEYRWAADHPGDKLAEAFLSLPWGTETIDQAAASNIATKIRNKLPRKVFRPWDREELLDKLYDLICQQPWYDYSYSGMLSSEFLNEITEMILSSKLLELVNYCVTDSNRCVIGQESIQLKHHDMQNICEIKMGNKMYFDNWLVKFMIERLSRRQRIDYFPEELSSSSFFDQVPRISEMPSNPKKDGYDNLVVPQSVLGSATFFVPGLRYNTENLNKLTITEIRGMPSCSILAKEYPKEKRSLLLGISGFLVSNDGKLVMRFSYDELPDKSYMVCG